MSTPENKYRIKAIAERIKELRKNAGYSSHEQFAFDNNIQPKQYWRLESGNEFKITTLFRIINIHGITLNEFFEDID